MASFLVELSALTGWLEGRVGSLPSRMRLRWWCSSCLSVSLGLDMAGVATAELKPGVYVLIWCVACRRPNWMEKRADR